MGLQELTATICVCQRELEKMGAYAGYLFEANNKVPSVQMRKENLPDGEHTFEKFFIEDQEWIRESVMFNGVKFFSVDEVRGV